MRNCSEFKLQLAVREPEENRIEHRSVALEPGLAYNRLPDINGASTQLCV